MFLATAVLLLHPQIATAIPSSANNQAVDTPAAISAANTELDTELPLPTLAASYTADALPAVGSNELLPDAPLPLAAAVTPTTPLAILPATPVTVSVKELRAENRGKELMWRGLIIASSGAAEFDAWSTRRTITKDGAQELNPLLKPFAGNASLYFAVQVAPAILDYAGRKMMYSRHSWLRRMWWAPQSASFVTSLFCGAHNLAYH
jgi:hypothetical protein